jgi:GT2 family glycosyltransferase
MNDAAVIEQLLDALRRQTRTLDAILIVDNASTDGTLHRALPENIEIVRNAANLGTSGAVHIGLNYALEHRFDWTWIFDADGVPEPDVLEQLLAFFERLPKAKREQLCFLACWPLTPTGEVKVGPTSFKGSALKYLSPNGLESFTECDCTLWSGSLYRMDAVAQIGLPSADYVLDVGELEYGYRARQLGFSSYLVHNVRIHHDVGRKPGSAGRLPESEANSNGSTEYVPARCYYLARNWIYFWLYQFTPCGIKHVLRAITRSVVFSGRFAVRPIIYRRQLIACMRGIRDGLTMHMERRY